MSPPWRTAWITGASTGIGREVAVRLARAGVKVAASARSADALAALAREVPGISAHPLDVANASATARVAAEVSRDLGPIDLALLNAGIWQPMGGTDFDAAKSAQSMAVNYQGVANAIAALAPAMIARGGGHLALVASVAGYRGLPKAAAYGPTKAAVIALAESLRPDLARHGVKVSVVNPGFVATPMTAVNTFPMPFMIPADDAAERIVRGLAAGRFEVAFPWPLVAALKLARVLPYPLFFWYARTFLAR